MINKSKLLYILSFMVAMFIGCEDNNDDPVADTTIPTPLTYEFESRFTEGESSVSYNGQVVRNLLINDIKGQFKGGNGTKVLSMMANDDASAQILTSAGTTVQSAYHDISLVEISWYAD